MPPYTKFITVWEIKRVTLERDFPHRTLVYGGINIHTVRNNLIISHKSITVINGQNRIIIVIRSNYDRE